MMNKWRILVVDDDPEIGQLVSDYLQKHQYQVDTARDAIAMGRQLKRHVYNLMILDVMLPGEDGISICKRLRESSLDIHIIMLTAMNEEADVVTGLEVGADDYIPKPFSPRELLARIKTLERLTEGPLAKSRQARQIVQLPNIQFNNWLLDRNKRRLMSPDGLSIPLSTGEYTLLSVFLKHPQRVLSRDQLLDITHNREAAPFDRTIDVQVARLRKKIEKDPKTPKIITTVRGGGYQFMADVSEIKGKS